MSKWLEERAASLNSAVDMLKSARATLQDEIPQLVADNQDALKTASLTGIYKNLKYAELVNSLSSPQE